MLESALRLVMPRTRPVRVPPGVCTVTVGGATVGGSGKTRIAVAVARALAERGERVVLIGHAYRARPGEARVVSPNDRLDAVGDEALVCARALEGIAKVVVAPSRQEAVDHALGAEQASVLVFDGPLQLRPRKATFSLLTIDPADPPPHRSLVAYADRVVPVASAVAPADVRDLRDRRFGLFTAIARPRRLLDALRREGLFPATFVEVSDHGPVSASARRSLGTAEVDVWVSTAKCACHLEGARLSAPLHVLTCLDPPIASALTLTSAL